MSAARRLRSSMGFMSRQVRPSGAGRGRLYATVWSSSHPRRPEENGGRAQQRSSTRLTGVSGQALEGIAVPIFYVDRAVERESSFMIPGEHVVYVHGIEAAVALEVSENSGAELFLERADCVCGQVRGG